MDNKEFEQARQTAQQIAERVKTDPSFKQQVLDDPTKTLKEAGLPESVIADFVRELGLEDVTGYIFGPFSACVLSVS